MKLGMVYGRGTAQVATPDMRSKIPSDIPASEGDIVSFVIVRGNTLEDSIHFEGVEYRDGYYSVRRNEYSDTSIFARPTGSHREFFVAHRE